MTDIVERLRGRTVHDCWGCEEWGSYPCEDAEEVETLLREAAARIAELERENAELRAELDVLAEDADDFLNLDNGVDPDLFASDGTQVASGGFWIKVDVEAARRLWARAARSAVSPAPVGLEGHTDPTEAP